MWQLSTAAFYDYVSDFVKFLIEQMILESKLSKMKQIHYSRTSTFAIEGILKRFYKICKNVLEYLFNNFFVLDIKNALKFIQNFHFKTKVEPTLSTHISK